MTTRKLTSVLRRRNEQSGGLGRPLPSSYLSSSVGYQQHCNSKIIMKCYFIVFLLCSILLLLHLLSDTLTVYQVIEINTTSIPAYLDNEVTLTSGAEQSQQRRQKHRLHLVVSHCDASVRWAWERYIHPFQFDTLTVITKCGKPPSESDFPDGSTLIYCAGDNGRSGGNYSVTNEGQIIQVLELPNVGRCDHSYAYWMQQLVEHHHENRYGSANTSLSLPTINFTNYNIDYDHDLVLFMKDNDNTYRGNWEEEVPFSAMNEQLLQERVSSGGTDGFACSSKLRTSWEIFQAFKGSFDPELESASNLAELVELGKFQMEYYSGARDESNNNHGFPSLYRPMSKWIDHLNTIPAINFSMSPDVADNHHRVVPMCFGGRFMTTTGRITQNGYIKDWTPFVEALSRGDNIEEGHYMERLWGALLSKPLPLQIQHQWIRRKVRHFPREPFTGLMTLTVDGLPLKLRHDGNDESFEDYCFNCRIHIATPDSNSVTSSLLNKCYSLMQLRECETFDDYEKLWRIENKIHGDEEAIRDSAKGTNAAKGNRAGYAQLKQDIKNLDQLWDEYDVGLDGHKAARLFTKRERSRLWYRRNVVWNIIDARVKAGDTVQDACNKIYKVYGLTRSVDDIIDMMVRDRRNGKLSADLKPAADLAPSLPDLQLLWEEYQNGLDGRKAARFFAPEEQNRVYARRKILWDLIERRIRAGDTVQVACDRIYEAYGYDKSVTDLINMVMDDQRKRTLPSLLV